MIRLLGASIVAVAHLVLASPGVVAATALLSCPTTPGVCRWDATSGLTVVWNSPNGRLIQGFQSIGADCWIAHSYDSQASGTAWLGCNASGLLLARKLHNGADLPAFSAVADGDLVLCGADSRADRCDVVISATDHDRVPELVARTDWFPAKCAFPRFGSDGSSMCITGTPLEYTLWSSGAGLGSPTTEVLPLPPGSLREVIPQWAALWVHSGESLLRVTAQKAQRVADQVLWVRRASDRIWVAQFGYEGAASSQIPPGHHRLSTLNQNGTLDVVLNEIEMVPGSIEPMSDGSCLLSVSNAGGSELWRLTGVGSDLRNEVIWRSSD